MLKTGIARFLCFFFFILVQAVGYTAYANQLAAFNSWAKTAKIAGAAVAVGMTDSEISQILDNMVAQKVTVIEADSDLSNYQSDSRFQLELDLIRQFSSAAHQRGLRVVWYFPALEVITVNGKNLPHTMAKDHPDWVQKGITGQPNVFYGGGGQVFWVPPDAESAWMSPSSTGYRQFFFNRIKKLVATGVDGLWIDVPIYADFGPTKWSGFNAEAVTKFESDTGMLRPNAENWSDPSWRRWIHWRHEELARFLTDLTNTARSLNPEFSIYAETLPTDYNGGTVYGLDASYLKSIEGLTEIWEIDTMSNNVGMRKAREDDWVSFISALKYAHAATGDKPSWVFSYGKQADDAQQVMLQALIAGNNPYELQVPEMTSTVGSTFRTRMFNWADIYSSYLFKAESTAKTGVFYSSESRDYVDKFAGLGMFATTDSGGDDLWWASSANESVYQRKYLAEYRGLIKILIHEHIPFNALVKPDLNELNRYQTILLPNVEAISDAESNLLRQYVQQGGHLIVTGPNPTGLNEYGNPRNNYALADVLGFSKGSPLPDSKTTSFGAGTCSYFSQRLGKQYLVNNTASARNTIASKVRNSSNISVSTNADRRIYVETSRLDEKAILQFTNFIGLNGNFSVEPQTINVTYTVPELKQVASVKLTNPDIAGANQSNVSYTTNGSEISFNIPITQYAMVIVSFDNTQTPVHNHTPAAGDDSLQTNIDTPLEFNVSSLLANDGDLDGDALSITQVEVTSATSGSISNLGNGNYRYTPAAHFTGVDVLRYAIDDGHGNSDDALIRIYVETVPAKYYPENITLVTARPDGDDITNFQQLDGNTYDIRYKASNGQRVVDWYATTTITEDPANISKIVIKYIGQYSLNNVTQKAYLYNYQTAAWELFETATVGNEDNYFVEKIIDTNIAPYISTQKKMRLRIRGTRSTGNLYVWADQLTWEVTSSASSSNIAPTAHSQSVETNKNTVKSILLTATDPEGQVLSYSIETQPQHGQLSGQAPNISYTPDNGYVGTDSFTFIANDGVLNSAAATVNITVLQTGTGGNGISNFVSNTAITLDGNLGDWSQLQSFGADADDIAGTGSQVDWREAWAAHDTENFYLAYRNDGAINTATWWPWAVYLDTDSNSATGYKLNNNLGADYLFNGENLWKYTGTGSNWSWLFVAGFSSSVNNDIAEIKVTRQMLGNPAQIRLSFIGDNSPFSSGVDYYPDSANAYFSYNLDGSNGGNTAPVANPQSLNMQTGASLPITLTATDAENDPLSYVVVTQPAHGSLSGTAPNITYTPSAGYSGTDSFTFKANDSQLDSNIATINITVVSQGTVSNPATISIDGSLTDWTNLQSFGVDANDISLAGAQADWQETWMAHDSNNLYLAYSNYGAINTASWWTWEVYLDTDSNKASGFNLGANLGADYLLDGGSLWKYSGSGSDWSWQYVGEMISNVNGNKAEIKISRASLGYPSTVNVIYRAGNGVFTGNYGNQSVDYFPNNTSTPFKYLMP